MMILKKILNILEIEILIILTIICTFLLSVCINKKDVLVEHAVFCTITFASSSLCLVMWVKNMFFFTIKKKHKKRKVTGQHIWGIVVTIFYCILIRLPQFGDVPRDDGSYYYKEIVKACNNFDFTWSQYINGFRIAGHPTQGYMSILAIGEFLFPGLYFGVIIMNLILAVISAYCILGIMTEVLTNISYKYIMISSMLISSIPLYMGTFSYFNPDMGVVYFFLIGVYCFIRGKYLLLLFALLFLCLTKEIGMVIAASFLAGIILEFLWEKRKSIKQKINIKNMVILSAILFFLAVFISIGAYYVLGGKLWNYQREEIEYFSTFGIYPEFIGFKLKEYFLLNFNWIAVLIILSCCIIKFVRKEKIAFSGVKRYVFGGCLLAYLAVAVFYCIYITFQHPRYTVILDVMLWVSALVILGYAIGDFGKKVKQLPLIFLSLLLFAQSYFTLDPLSLLLFKGQDTGCGKILEIYSDFIGYFGPGDPLIYNNHYRYLERTYTSLFDDINYDGNMDIIKFGTVGYLGGEHDEISWDMKRKTRTWVSNNNTVVFRIVNGYDLGKKEVKNKEAVYVCIPQYGGNSEEELKILAEYYDIDCHGEIIIPGGGKIDYWQCRLKGNNT